MAKNRVYTNGQYAQLVCTTPAVPASGDPVLIGQMPGVAQRAEEADGVTSVDLGPAVYSLSVSANFAAINIGDKIYAHAASPVTLDNTAAGGVPFGFAWGAIANGQTATINVKIMPT